MKLSICMMVKNESGNLHRCLTSIVPLMNEIDSELIIVDTGSEDNTIEIAKKYTEKVYEHLWNNNFSEMRNKTLSYATGDWVFILDADEELVEFDGISSFLKTSKPKNTVAASIKLINIVRKNGKKGATVSTLRLFKNGSVHYVGTVHNLPRYDGNAVELNGLLYHYGYVADDQMLMEEKFRRTSTLLINALEEDPTNVYYWYQLGVTYSMHGDITYAVSKFDKGYEIILNKGEKNKEFLYFYGSYANELVNSKRYNDALIITESGLKIDEEYLDLWYYNGISYISLNRIEEGIKSLETYLKRLDFIESSDIIRNPSIQLYTLRLKDEVLYNLSLAYSLIMNYEKELELNLSLIREFDESSPVYMKAINAYISTTFKTMSYKSLNDIYEIISVDKYKELDRISYFYYHEHVSSVEMLKEFLSNEVEINSLFGRYLKEIGLYVNNKDISDLDKTSLMNEFFESEFYEVLLLGLKFEIDIKKWFISMSPLKLMEEISYLDNKFPTFKRTTIDYVGAIEKGTDYLYYYAMMQLSKYIGLREYEINGNTDWFGRYVHFGKIFLSKKYTFDFIEGEYLMDFKNSEEQYLACLWHISNSNSIQALESANRIFPEWSDLLLKWLDSNLDIRKDEQIETEELKELKRSIKLNIKTLIDQNQVESALILVNEFLSIFPEDEEIKSTRNKLLKVN